ncbi:MAG: PEGA domain-containing protein [Blastocatellia bacterium]
MNNPTKRMAIFIAALCLMLMTLAVFGQERRLNYDDWYGDVKKTLADHYTGKIVKLRMAIPATRRGLELVDGSFGNGAATSETLAQSGDDLTIKSFIVRDHDIELLLNKNGEKPKGWFFPKKPRIKLRFSRELVAKDLTIETINRWLSETMDVTSLTPAGADPATQASVAPLADPVAKPAMTKAATGNVIGLPTPTTLNDLPQAVPGIAELTIECPGKHARVYIDDTYSGFAPRTIKLRAGVHSILVMADGYAAWEQKLFIPERKASIVKAELSK